MRRLFEIEWSDDLGKEWMNKDNLLICIEAYCKGVKLTVRDATPVKGSGVQSPPLGHGRGMENPHMEKRGSMMAEKNETDNRTVKQATLSIEPHKEGGYGLYANDDLLMAFPPIAGSGQVKWPCPLDLVTAVGLLFKQCNPGLDCQFPQ